MRQTKPHFRHQDIMAYMPLDDILNPSVNKAELPDAVKQVIAETHSAHYYHWCQTGLGMYYLMKRAQRGA